MPSTQTDRLYGMTTSVAVKPPCRVQTTAAITLSGEQTVNGVAVVTGDRVLVKDQADNTTNGIYIADTSAWSRAPDFDGSLDAVDGTLVLVHNASGPDQLWELSATNPVIIGTSALTFSLSSLGATTFGASLVAAANAAAARVVLAVTSIGDALFTAVSAAAARATLGSTTVGDALFIAADAAAARTAIGAQASGSYATSGAVTGSGLTQTTARLLGRTTAGTGAVEEITVGSGLSLSGGELTATTAPASTVRVNTDNGFGSTNTAIRRFTNVVTNIGADITYADSATLGATFTINATGNYGISYSSGYGTAGTVYGVSLNSSQLTTPFGSITIADVLATATTAGVNYSGTAATTVYLTAGDVVRAHAVASATAGAQAQFTITRVS